jgi:hypothetical protein
MATPQHPVRGSQPTLSDWVVWLTPWHDDDDVALGDFNLDPAHARWFDQPPPDPDRERRRVWHAEVIRRWRDEWTSGASLTFALRTAEDAIAIGEADLQPRRSVRTSPTPSHPNTEGGATHREPFASSPRPV